MDKQFFQRKWTFIVMGFALVALIIGCGSTKSPGTSKSAGGSAPAAQAASNVVERVLQQAAQGGMEVVHHAKVVPSGAYSPGQITFPAGTEYNGFSPDGVNAYYKNKTDSLTIAGTSEGIKYINGKGVVKYKGKLYCFGF